MTEELKKLRWNFLYEIADKYHKEEQTEFYRSLLMEFIDEIGEIDYFKEWLNKKINLNITEEQVDPKDILEEINAIIFQWQDYKNNSDEYLTKIKKLFFCK